MTHSLRRDRGVGTWTTRRVKCQQSWHCWNSERRDKLGVLKLNWLTFIMDVTLIGTKGIRLNELRYAVSALE